MSVLCFLYASFSEYMCTYKDHFLMIGGTEKTSIDNAVRPSTKGLGTMGSYQEGQQLECKLRLTDSQFSY